MSSKVLIFGLVAFAQLAIPAWMIMDHERVRNDGEVFRFKTAPIDPRDPFRGEYVRLDFAAERGSWSVADSSDIYTGASGSFALLGTDTGGYAMITSLQRERPEGVPFVRINYTTWGNDSVNRVSLPFDRFYLEEGDGKKTESLLGPEWNDGEMTQPLPAYAEVRILDGEAVITDLIVGGRSIHEWLKEL